MATIYQPNKAPPGGGADWFSQLWYLTRLLLKSGWRHLSSSDGTTKVTTIDPGSNAWGAPAALGGQTGVVASIGAQTGKDFVFTGLTGLVSPTNLNQGGSEGNILTITGASNAGNNTNWQITKVISAASCNARPVAGTTGVATDANNGAIHWTEKSYLTTGYPALGSNAWLNIQGPTTLKIPFAVAPTGIFLRGENVVQSTTGAEGEVLGVTYEPTTGIGWMVVSPRLQGSGADPEGWDHSHVITGAKSGATVTPSATNVRFVRELVYFRGTTAYAGTIYYQCVDDVGETASRFSTLAASAGCTASVAPGAGGAGNGFPTPGSYCAVGTGGSVAHGTSAWNRSQYSNGFGLGNGQFFVANCIDKQNTSQDGSHFGLLGQPSQSVTSAGSLPFLMRFDSGEEGDVEPYGYFCAAAASYGSRSRTVNTISGPYIEGGGSTAIFGFATSCQPVLSWRRRGLSGESFVEVIGNIDCSFVNGAVYMLSTNVLTDPEKVASTGQTTAPLALEFPRMNGNQSGTKIRKGQPRWICLGNGNNAYDTFGGRTWLQCGPIATNDVTQLPVFCPYDGTTVPVQ